MASPRDNARQQLAQKNGKPRDLNRVMGQTDAQAVYAGLKQGQATATDGSIVERGPDGRIYRYVPKFDYTTVTEPNGTTYAPKRGNQLPSGINGYIDKVLGMSGMNSPSNVPTPTERPDVAAGGDSGMTGTDQNIGKLTDDTIPMDPQAPNATPTASTNDGWGITDLLLGALGIGGTALGAKALMSRMSRGGQQAAGDVAEAGAPQNVSPGKTVDDAAMAQPAIEEEQRLALPEPQKRLPAPEPEQSSTDKMIDATTGDAQQDAAAGSPVDEDLAARMNVEQEGARPAKQGRFGDAGSVPNEVVAKARAMIDGGDVRGAFRILQEAGIPVDDNMIRAAALRSNTAKSIIGKSLIQRAGEAAGPVVRGAARGAVRGAE